MGKRQNDESGKKQPPRPKRAHSRRGGQIKEDLAAMRDRLDVMNARLGSLCAAEQDLKLARQECAEGARLLGEMTKERDMALFAKVKGIPADSKIVFVWSDQDTTPGPEGRLISEALQRSGAALQIVYVPRDFRVEVMTDQELERIGLCRVLNADDAQKERDRFVRELGEAHRRLAQNETELSSLRTIVCSQDGAIHREQYDRWVAEREALLRDMEKKDQAKVLHDKLYEDKKLEFEKVCRENWTKRDEISRLQEQLKEVEELRERIRKSDEQIKKVEALSEEQADKIAALTSGDPR